MEKEYCDFLNKLVGKFISFIYNKKYYNKVLVTKDEGKDKFRLLNNEYPNNDEHKDKTEYKFSYLIDCNDDIEPIKDSIKLLEPEEMTFNIF